MTYLPDPRTEGRLYRNPRKTVFAVRLEYEIRLKTKTGEMTGKPDDYLVDCDGHLIVVPKGQFESSFELVE